MVAWKFAFFTRCLHFLKIQFCASEPPSSQIYNLIRFNIKLRMKNLHINLRKSASLFEDYLIRVCGNNSFQGPLFKNLYMKMKNIL